MTLKKDQDIINLLDRLQISSRGWRVEDHWEADLCAIGIAKEESPRLLVYVSTYDRTSGRYDYQCETPADSGTDSYITKASGENVSYKKLLRVMEDHLD